MTFLLAFSFFVSFLTLSSLQLFFLRKHLLTISFSRTKTTKCPANLPTFRATRPKAPSTKQPHNSPLPIELTIKGKSKWACQPPPPPTPTTNSTSPPTASASATHLPASAAAGAPAAAATTAAASTSTSSAITLLEGRATAIRWSWWRGGCFRRDGLREWLEGLVVE